MGQMITGDFSFLVDYDKKEARILEINTTKSDVQLPREIDGCNVMAIMREAFKNNKTMQTVEIPNTIQYIGARAFQNTNIISVRFEEPENANSSCNIYNSVFMDCKELKLVHLSEHVQFMDWNIFGGCSNLRHINSDVISGEIPTFTFKDCSNLKTFIVSNVVDVKENAFENVILDSFVEHEPQSVYAEDIWKAIKYATIHCFPSSKLSHMAYYGGKVLFIQ